MQFWSQIAIITVISILLYVSSSCVHMVEAYGGDTLCKYTGSNAVVKDMLAQNRLLQYTPSRNYKKQSTSDSDNLCYFNYDSKGLMDMYLKDNTSICTPTTTDQLLKNTNPHSSYLPTKHEQFPRNKCVIDIRGIPEYYTYNADTNTCSVDPKGVVTESQCNQQIRK